MGQRLAVTGSTPQTGPWHTGGNPIITNALVPLKRAGDREKVAGGGLANIMVIQFNNQQIGVLFGCDVYHHQFTRHGFAKTGNS